MSKAEIRSPLPGVFYRAPTPESPPFKADGADVAAGDVVGIIEVMKSFHELNADVGGSNVRYVVDDGDAVMAGQVIAEVDQ